MEGLRTAVTAPWEGLVWNAPGLKLVFPANGYFWIWPLDVIEPKFDLGLVATSLGRGAFSIQGFLFATEGTKGCGQELVPVWTLEEDDRVEAKLKDVQVDDAE